MWEIDFPSPRMDGSENLKCKIDFPPPRMTCSENLFSYTHHGLGMVIWILMGNPLEFQIPNFSPKFHNFVISNSGATHCWFPSLDSILGIIIIIGTQSTGYKPYCAWVTMVDNYNGPSVDPVLA